MQKLKVSIAQINPTVGAISYNLDKILKVREKHSSCDLVIYSECVLTGYPVEDLVGRPEFMYEVHDAIEKLSQIVKSDNLPEIIIGSPYLHHGKVYNAAIYFSKNGNTEIRFKSELPNYDVFDEMRNFHRGKPTDNLPIEIKGFKIGLMICEDGWLPNVTRNLRKHDCEAIFWINGSPFCQGKDKDRKDILHKLNQKEPHIPLFYINQVGGQDDVVFDGASFVSNKEDKIIAQLPAFLEAEAEFELSKTENSPIEVKPISNNPISPYPQHEEAIYNALMLALRDYVEKNRFPFVILGLSGGIDSALVAAIAGDALGADKVWAIRLPSKWTSDESNDLALQQCQKMGVRCDTIAIGDAVAAIEKNINALKDIPFLNRDEKQLMEENVQSRERGQTLMALSNRYYPMVVSTGNKSEYSTGYATLYGDMCGGYALIKDVWKLMVFRLCKWRNLNRPQTSRLDIDVPLEIIPPRVIERPPTAELKDNQCDEVSLMPYEYLDVLLMAMVEDEMSNDNTALMLLEKFGAKRNWCDDVDKMRRLIDLNEYKRRQSAPGPKITKKSYGKGRRYPITNGFREVCSSEVRAKIEQALK